MDQTKLSRKEREYLRHRREILQVALKLFSGKGFHRVTMQEIAEESEFAVGTLYKFFSNKEDLYKALILEKAVEFHSALMAALEKPGSEMTRIKAWVEAKIKVFSDNADFVRLYMAETQGASFNLRVGLDTEIRRQYDETLEEIKTVFQRGIAKKLFRRCDPRLLAVALDGITNALLFEHLEHPNKHPFDANLISDIFFQQVYEKGEMEK
ncbi:MAG: TetR/AcrR family transcriptional regulator [Deltaproteobacteria bacterium]|nr:TetR/AcrR family transcriptional regulator [Deltaproteobacteria bacterium]